MAASRAACVRRSSARLHDSTLKMMPIPEGVALPNVFSQIKDGKFTGNESQHSRARRRR